MSLDTDHGCSQVVHLRGRGRAFKGIGRGVCGARQPGAMTNIYIYIIRQQILGKQLMEVLV